MTNSIFLNLDLEYSDNGSSTLVVSIITDNLLLPDEQFSKIYSQLNEGQQHLYIFIMQYALSCKLAENIQLPPKPFQIWLSGSTGVGKSFLIKIVIEYLKWILSCPNQNLDQPSLLVTTSFVKAATVMNSITLHSPYYLLVQSVLKSYQYKKPSDEMLHLLINKYQYLKFLITDEISMIERETFEHLRLPLKTIMQNLSPFVESLC